MNALYAGLDTPAPFELVAEENAGLKEFSGPFASGGGRAGSEDGGCGVAEEDLRPGGGGKDMMNGCPEENVDAISDVPNYCQQASVTAASQARPFSYAMK